MITIICRDWKTMKICIKLFINPVLIATFLLFFIHYSPVYGSISHNGSNLSDPYKISEKVIYFDKQNIEADTLIIPSGKWKKTSSQLTVVYSITNNSAFQVDSLIYLKFFITADSVLDSSDSVLDSVNLENGLGAGESTGLKQIIISVPDDITPGLYRFGFIASFNQNDTTQSEDINIFITSGQYFISTFKPVDLKTEHVSMISEIPPYKGMEVMFKTVIRNTGYEILDSLYQIDFFLSHERENSSSDIFIKSVNLSLLLNPGDRTDTLFYKFIVPDSLATGDYYITASVDPNNSVQETDENNNISYSPESYKIFSFKPVDILVDSWTINTDKPLYKNGYFISKITYKNIGYYTFNDTVSFYVAFKRDTLKSSWSYMYYYGRVTRQLGPGESSGIHIYGMHVPNLSEGTYYLTMTLNSSKTVNEINYDNNFSYFSKPIYVYEFRPVDLVATSINLNIKDPIQAGDKINATYNIKNSGIYSTISPVPVNFYISEDSNIDSTDILLGTAEISKQIPDSSSLDSINIELEIPDSINTGEYYIGYVIDQGSSIQELDEDNNTVKSEEKFLIYGNFDLYSIEDIPNDMGGQVRLSWSRHRCDSMNASEEVIKRYSIWRGITFSAQTNGPDTIAHWDFIKEIPAHVDISYQTVVPTIIDSSAGISGYQSYFRIIAHMENPDSFYTSTIRSGFSVNNISPFPIQMLNENDFSFSPGQPGEFKILHLRDVPNDQGRKIRLTWNPHKDDKTGTQNHIDKYSIWRKIDFNLQDYPEKPDSPAGYWDFICEIPAIRSNIYHMVVPTLADSTLNFGSYMSPFYISAHYKSNNETVDTPPDSGCSRDNLPPHDIQTLEGMFAGNISLSWKYNNDPDFSHYAVYRGITESYPLNEEHQIGITRENHFLDTNAESGYVYYYTIGAWDISGNSSVTSVEVWAMSISDINDRKNNIPEFYDLKQNFPNPFNPETKIKYAIPKSSFVKLEIFSETGMLIRILVSKKQPPGYYSTVWNGRNESGIKVGSGLYIYRITAGDFIVTKKMLLLK